MKLKEVHDGLVNAWIYAYYVWNKLFGLSLTQLKRYFDKEGDKLDIISRTFIKISLLKGHYNPRLQ